MLGLSAVLCGAMVAPYQRGMTLRLGLAASFGNREGVPELTGWVGRAKRAHANMLENLVPFAVLLLGAHALGKAGWLSTLGAQIFFYGRLGHAVAYIAGVIYVRSLLYFIALAGTLLVAVDYFA